MGFFNRNESQSLATAGTYLGNTYRVKDYDKVCMQFDTLKYGSAASKVYIQLRTHPYASWTELQVSGSDFEHTPAASTGFIDSTGKLTFTSVSTVNSGNEIKIVLEDTGTAGAETVTVATTTSQIDNVGVFYSQILITVGIEAGVSTAAQVKAALDGDATAASYVSTVVTTAAAMGVGEVILSGGSFVYDIETAGYEVRAKIVVTTGSTGAMLRTFISAKS